MIHSVQTINRGHRSIGENALAIAQIVAMNMRCGLAIGPQKSEPAPAPLPTARMYAVSIARIAVFLVSLDVTVLYAAFPALRAAFPDSSAGDLSWVLNAYTVIYAALLVPAGRFADLRGRKRIFLTGLGVFLVASLACGLATLDLFNARIARALPPPHGGLLAVPHGPGLGVDVSDDALAEVLVEEFG